MQRYRCEEEEQKASKRNSNGWSSELDIGITIEQSADGVAQRGQDQTRTMRKHARGGAVLFRQDQVLTAPFFWLTPDAEEAQTLRGTVLIKYEV